MENHVKYQEAVYFASNDNETLYINLFVPSELHWRERGITILQTGGFPSEDIKITIKGKEHFTCKLRVPHWCREGYVVSINEEFVPIEASPSTYISITRDWEENDTIHIHIPFRLYLEETTDKLDLQVASVMYGPFVMVAKNSSRQWITLSLAPDLEDSFSISCLGDMPVLNHCGLEFIPMYAAYNIDYHTYFKLMPLMQI